MNKRRYSNRRRKNILRVFILLMTIIITVVMWRTIKIDVQVGELTLPKILQSEKSFADTSGEWNLILVNRNHYIPNNYQVELTELSNGKKVDSRIYPELQQMFNDARAEGLRIMGISATIFVVLIIPEIWKNRRNGAIEIEQASYYTLRQICTARMLMFGVVDLVIVMVFLAITYQTTILSLSDLVVNFLLPVNVSCCICFRVLYSRWEKSEYIAVLSCLVWVGLWMMIVANDVIYQKIVTPVWVVMLILTFVYFVFCVQKSLVFDEKILEDYTYEIRI